MIVGPLCCFHSESNSVGLLDLLSGSTTNFPFIAVEIRSSSDFSASGSGLEGCLFPMIICKFLGN